MLYKLLIGPLELLFELIFALALRGVSSPGIAIIFLSLIVNLLVFPFYRRADTMQQEERDLERKMRPWTDHIRKTFSGDERFMMLQTFYRQNNYKPSYTLRGSLSLFLQIPFFTAAYRFLSGLTILSGASFGPIRDLGAPDAMLTVGGFAINVLPVLMTLINIGSATIYMKDFPVKNKLQAYGLALIFLVLLYHAPAGLAFYWMLNNLFSLVKNIFYKLHHPGRILAAGASLAGLGLLAYILIRHPFDSSRKTAIVIAAVLMLQIPLILNLLKSRGIRADIPAADKTDSRIFLLCSIFMALFTGILIPSAVIKAAPEDFVIPANYYSPMWYILCALLLAAGTFIIWFGIFFHLAAPSGKKLMSMGMVIFSFCSVIDYMFFGTDRGDMSNLLRYDEMPADSIRLCLLNLAVLAAAAGLILLAARHKRNLIKGGILIVSLAAAVMCWGNISGITKDLARIRVNSEDPAKDLPKITLSKTGRNVIILMMDRSIGFYIPFIFEERPELREQFEGFTFYPDTLSFSSKTNEGLPAIYGGYEYTPAQINRRSDLTLAEKHNEALRMMPILFDEAGFHVTVFDPAYAGYQTVPDLHIYDDHPNIKAQRLEGKFSMPAEFQEKDIRTRQRNFFCFSIYKIAPLIVQPTLYASGSYNSQDGQAYESLLISSGMRDNFWRAYSVLLNLPSITHAGDSAAGTFTSLGNNATHEPVLLQMPDYLPSEHVDNTAYETLPITRTSIDGRTVEMTATLQVTHYHINMAAYLLLGQWMDHLRENGIYDNTRIIIVADHGNNQGYPEHRFGEKLYEDVLTYNPVLMVKDFESNDPFAIDGQFMTNADVPTIAMSGLISDPVNPATGKPVSDEAKKNPIHKVNPTSEWDIRKNHGNTFLPGDWYALHGDDIFDLSSWEYLGLY